MPTLDTVRRLVGRCWVPVALFAAFLAVGSQFVTWAPPVSQRQVRADFDALESALKFYKLTVGAYPGQLEALWLPPLGVTSWRGPYLADGWPKDPWGNRYRYSPKARAESLPHACDSLRAGCVHAGALPKPGPLLYSWGADGEPGGQGEDADLILRQGWFKVGPDWVAEVESDLRVIRRSIRNWELEHPGQRVWTLAQLPTHAQRSDPWGSSYVYLPQATLPISSSPTIALSAPVDAELSAGQYVLLSLGADRAWGGAGLAGDRGWSSCGGGFSPEPSPVTASSERRVVLGALSGASVIAIPSGLLLVLLWLRRRRKRAPAPAEVVLASLGGRCAFCHDDAFGVAAPCPQCRTLLHAMCWHEAGACPSLGCRGYPKAWFALRPQAATIKDSELRQLAAESAPGLPRTA